MQQEQKQTNHGGTGEQETELGSVKDEHQDGENSVQSGDSDVRNPSGDDIAEAVDGDEGSGRRV